MANLRLLVNRRKAIRNIRKITRTMELIATARFKKAMDRATEAAAYTRKIGELAADLSASAGEVSHPLLEKRSEIKNHLLLVICANRGLCGGYNGSIIRIAQNRMKDIKTTGAKNPIELSGKRAIAFFKFQGIVSQATYTQFEDKPTFEQVDELAEKYLQLYIQGEVDRIDVAFMKFINPARQTPVVETLLPLEADAARGTTGGPKVEYEYLPNAADIQTELLPAAFKAKLFKCFLDAAVSEQIARRVAMKAATENAGDMIRDLSLEYNRARQAQITKEIAELIGGSEALK